MIACQHPKLLHSDASPNKDFGDGYQFCLKNNSTITDHFHFIHVSFVVLIEIERSYRARETISLTQIARMQCSKFHSNRKIRTVHSCVFVEKKAKQHRIELIKTSKYMYIRRRSNKFQIPIVFATEKCAV